MLRAYAGDRDREFADARVEEIKMLLDDPTLAGLEGIEAPDTSTVDGYRRWSVSYDGPNGLYPPEEPFVHGIVDALPVGTAIDAACGTGRQGAYLAERGHQVIGVDSSAEMLDIAKQKAPNADWLLGDLDRLPVPDDHADLVVCSLALAHIPSLTEAFAEFARVLRPGGHLITTDIHPESILVGSVPHVRTEAGAPELIATYRHRLSDYLAAALPHDFQVKACSEPGRIPAHDPAAQEAESAPWPDPDNWPEWDGWPSTLQSLTRAATVGAWEGLPALTMWHFRLPE